MILNTHYRVCQQERERETERERQRERDLSVIGYSVYPPGTIGRLFAVIVVLLGQLLYYVAKRSHLILQMIQ